jgi:hypothetical protein
VPESCEQNKYTKRKESRVEKVVQMEAWLGAKEERTEARGNVKRITP